MRGVRTVSQHPMPRPSRNIDALLLRAGRELFPVHGVRGLSVRKVAGRAGVNLGMFHYHFGTKQAFVQRLLQEIYDDMFARLELAASARTTMEALRGALVVLGRFARDNARLLRRLVADALDGDALAIAFIRTNMPRHVGVLGRLIRAAQRDHSLVRMPLPQAIAFLAGSIAVPALVAAALGDRGLLPAEIARGMKQAIGTDAAIAQRVDCALAGLAPRAAAGKRAR